MICICDSDQIKPFILCLYTYMYCKYESRLKFTGPGHVKTKSMPVTGALLVFTCTNLR